jgi:predicted ArsR family transcriptional regulator
VIRRTGWEGGRRIVPGTVSLGQEQPGTGHEWSGLTELNILYSVKTNLASIGGPQPGYGPLPTAQMKRRRSHLSTAQAAILEALIDQPEPCTVAALSAQIGQHANTIREHLDRLSNGGLVVRTQAPPQGRGRPAWLYSAAREVGSDQGAREYAALACVLAAHVGRTSAQPSDDAIEAGRMWGRDLVRASDLGMGQVSAARSPSAVATRRTVVGLLEGLGFAPSTDARVSVVKLHRCPLLEAAHKNPQVVCSVHLGLVRGALDELGADPERTEVTALRPFSEPGACRLDMLPRPKTAE